jgi:hypothetical protein
VRRRGDARAGFAAAAIARAGGCLEHSHSFPGSSYPGDPYPDGVSCAQPQPGALCDPLAIPMVPGDEPRLAGGVP